MEASPSNTQMAISILYQRCTLLASKYRLMRYNHGSNGCSPSNLGACCIKALRIFISSIPSLLAYLSSSFFSRASRSTCNARAKALEIASVWSTELWELCNTWGGGGNDSRWLILDHASSYYLLGFLCPAIPWSTVCFGFAWLGWAALAIVTFLLLHLPGRFTPPLTTVVTLWGYCVLQDWMACWPEFPLLRYFPRVSWMTVRCYMTSLLLSDWSISATNFPLIYVYLRNWCCAYSLSLRWY